MVYTGDTVGDPSRRRTSVAIEPMTCPPTCDAAEPELWGFHPEVPGAGAGAYLLPDMLQCGDVLRVVSWSFPGRVAPERIIR